MGVVTIPAPIGGLNCRNGVQAYAEGDAIRLTNLIPRAGFLETRPGTSYFSTTSQGAGIHTIFGHSNGTAVIGASTWLVSTAALGTTIATGLSGANFQGVTISNVVVLLNGANTPKVYNGTTAIDMVATGPTLSTLWNGIAFKGRAYYWAISERKFWYAAAGSYQGTLTSFDLSTQTRGDGTLVVAVTMTMDGGNGPDDYIAFVFSDGETLIYQGDDPGAATSWQLVGRFDIPKPLGPQCVVNIGSASVVATDAGPVDLVEVMRRGPADAATVFNQKIGIGPAGPLEIPSAKVQFSLDTANKVLWCFYHDTTIGSFVYQAIGMDIETKSWFSTSGWDNFQIGDGRYATCIGSFGGRTYIGDVQGRLSLIGADALEDTIGRSGGAAVSKTFDLLTTYSYAGDPGTRKQVNGLAFVTEYKPSISSNYANANVTEPTSMTCAAKFDGSDVSPTGGTASLGSAAITIKDQAWRGCGDAGYSVAAALRGTGGGIRIYGIKMMLKPMGER